MWLFGVLLEYLSLWLRDSSFIYNITFILTSSIKQRHFSWLLSIPRTLSDVFTRNASKFHLLPLLIHQTCKWAVSFWKISSFWVNLPFRIKEAAFLLRSVPLNLHLSLHRRHRTISSFISSSLRTSCSSYYSSMHLNLHHVCVYFHPSFYYRRLPSSSKTFSTFLPNHRTVYLLKYCKKVIEELFEQSKIIHEFLELSKFRKLIFSDSVLIVIFSLYRVVEDYIRSNLPVYASVICVNKTFAFSLSSFLSGWCFWMGSTIPMPIFCRLAWLHREMLFLWCRGIHSNQLFSFRQVDVLIKCKNLFYLNGIVYRKGKYGHMEIR